MPADAAQPWRRGELTTPLGPLVLVEDAAGRLRAAEWLDAESRLAHWLARQCLDHVPQSVTVDALAASAPLTDYFAGALSRLDDIAVALRGTPLQQAVWSALRMLRAGETRSYGAARREPRAAARGARRRCGQRGQSVRGGRTVPSPGRHGRRTEPAMPVASRANAGCWRTKRGRPG